MLFANTCMSLSKYLTPFLHCIVELFVPPTPEQQQMPESAPVTGAQKGVRHILMSILFSAIGNDVHN